MEGHGLSHSEQRALYAIEEALRHDAAALDRRLRSMTPRFRHRVLVLADRPLTYLAALLAIASAVLLVVGVKTSSAAIIWSFAGCWTVTLLVGALSCRRPRRRPASRVRHTRPGRR